jgi:hypothetical protein
VEADGNGTPGAVDLPMLSTASTGQFYQGLGKGAVDPTRGILMVRAFNCQGLTAGGVDIEAVGGNVECSSAYSLASSNTVSVDSPATGRGIAGFIKLPLDALTLTASAPGRIEFARVTVLARPNADLRAGR